MFLRNEIKKLNNYDMIMYMDDGTNHIAIVPGTIYDIMYVAVLTDIQDKTIVNPDCGCGTVVTEDIFYAGTKKYYYNCNCPSTGLTNNIYPNQTTVRRVAAKLICVNENKNFITVDASIDKGSMVFSIDISMIRYIAPYVNVPAITDNNIEFLALDQNVAKYINNNESELRTSGVIVDNEANIDILVLGCRYQLQQTLIPNNQTTIDNSYLKDKTGNFDFDYIDSVTQLKNTTETSDTLNISTNYHFISDAKMSDNVSGNNVICIILLPDIASSELLVYDITKKEFINTKTFITLPDESDMYSGVLDNKIYYKDNTPYIWNGNEFVSAIPITPKEEGYAGYTGIKELSSSTSMTKLSFFNGKITIKSTLTPAVPESFNKVLRQTSGVGSETFVAYDTIKLANPIEAVTATHSTYENYSTDTKEWKPEGTGKINALSKTGISGYDTLWQAVAKLEYRTTEEGEWVKNYNLIGSTAEAKPIYQRLIDILPEETKSIFTDDMTEDQKIEALRPYYGRYFRFISANPGTLYRRIKYFSGPTKEDFICYKEYIIEYR